MRPVNLLFVLCIFMVSACTEAPLESYEPVVDRFLVDRVQYNRDITECRSVATGAMAQAKQRRDAQMAPNILTSLLIGRRLATHRALDLTPVRTAPSRVRCSVRWRVLLKAART